MRHFAHFLLVACDVQAGPCAIAVMPSSKKHGVLDQ
jgi:hypothetical protein